MILVDFSKRKQDYKMKKLKYYSNIFKKKIKYDKRIKINKSESKKLAKNIEDIDKDNEKLFKHYNKKEIELIEYIAELNVKNYENEAYLTPELKEINKNNLKLIDNLKRKRIKILDEERKELEQIVENYEIKATQNRDNKIYDRIEKDYLVFKKMEEAKQKLEKLQPKFKILEKEINKISEINNDLKRQYDIIKVENKCLLSLLEKLNKKNLNYNNNNSSIIKKNYLNKSMILKGQNILQLKKENNNTNRNPYTLRLKYNNKILNSQKKKFSNSIILALSSNDSSYNFKNSINRDNSEKNIKNNFFISQKSSIYKKMSNKNRCLSAKSINSKCNNDEKNKSKNKYIIKLLKELISNMEKKYNEEYILYSKEIENQNRIRNLISTCVEDLNIEYKREKNDIEKKEVEKNNIKNKQNSLENKIFIFSYIYDNCLNNGEIKELKRQYSMFQPKKMIILK